MPSIPKGVSERLSKEIRKFQRVLKVQLDRDINESDTVVIETDILSEMFGFDKYNDITSEYSIRGTFCDLAVKVDGNVKYLIEVKAIGLDLRESHIRQAIGYGAQHGIQWVVLTNGVDWEIYRIKFEKPLGHSLLTKFNMLDLSSRKKEDHEVLYLLCKEGLTKATTAMGEYDTHIRSVNRFVISAILQAEASINLVRRELKRVAPGIKVDADEIQSILLSDVLKRDVIEGDSADKAKARVKRASGRALKKRRPKPKPQPEPEVEQSPDSTPPGDDTLPPEVASFHPTDNS